MTDLEAFRAEIRAWLEANCPAEMREPVATKTTSAGAAAMSSSRTRRRSNGSKPASPRAIPFPIGRRNMAAPGCARPRPRSGARKWPGSARARRCRASASGCSARRCCKFGTEEQKSPLSQPDRARRNPLVPGLFGTGQRVSDLVSPADLRRGQGRSLGRQRPEDLDQLCRQGRLDFLPRPHRQGEQVSGHQLPAVRHGQPGRQHQADPADQRQLPVLRNLLRQCRSAQGPDSSANSTAAGTSPNICSATSAR